MRRIGVFCGSSVGARAVYAEAASALGGLIARRGLGLVYGGGNVGLMGVVADGALREGGEVIGVIPRALMEKELAHLGLTELHVTTSMHERKARMAELSDAFVALPGGLGTLEELCEMVTWAQLGLHHKPCGLLDVDGYYGPFLAMLDHAVEEGFVRREHRALLCAERDPAALLDRLAEARPPVREKWAERVPP